ncbi:DUF732 domain-containing protein [Mycobacterium sp. IS-2888]|uniref:DUF732 domain-containing protein n=1 Tax=Mycobacterium sp. IS-2888 TaxID=1834159 RepID=UPI00352BB089
MHDDARKVIGTSFTILAGVLGELGLLAPTAHADANQYLADLHSPGMAHPSIPDSGLVAIGNDVCAKVSGGATSDAARDWLVGHLAHGGYQASNAEAGTVVYYALQDLCPGAGH